MVDERLYRLRSKDGSHFNEKTNEEGWNSAVQFDEENNPIRVAGCPPDAFAKTKVNTLRL